MGQRDGVFLGGRGDCVVGEGGRGVVEEAAGGGGDGGVGQYCVLRAEGWGVMVMTMMMMRDWMQFGC